MDSISHMPSQDLSNSFHRWLNPLSFSLSRSISKIQGGSRHHFSTGEDRRSVSSKNCPFSRRFMALLNSFHPSEAIQESFLVRLSRVHQFRFIHSQPSVIILQSYRRIIQISSNQFMISSFSCI